MSSLLRLLTSTVYSRVSTRNYLYYTLPCRTPHFDAGTHVFDEQTIEAIRAYVIHEANSGRDEAFYESLND